jgi:hypothetical protein
VVGLQLPGLVDHDGQLGLQLPDGGGRVVHGGLRGGRRLGRDGVVQRELGVAQGVPGGLDLLLQLAGHGVEHLGLRLVVDQLAEPGDQRVGRLAHGLRALGEPVGDVVAVVAELLGSVTAPAVGHFDGRLQLRQDRRDVLAGGDERVEHGLHGAGLAGGGVEAEARVAAAHGCTAVGVVGHTPDMNAS